MDFPPAEGVRLTWADLPAHVHAEIEARLGAHVVEAVSHSAGFSPGLASRLRTADGADVFVKAVSGVATPHSVDIHRREARIAAALPAEVAAPRLRWSFDDGDWVVLAFDFVDRPHAGAPVAFRRPRPRARGNDRARRLAHAVPDRDRDRRGGVRRRVAAMADLSRRPGRSRPTRAAVAAAARRARRARGAVGRSDARLEPAPPRRARRQPAAHRRRRVLHRLAVGRRRARRGST